ncbi:MAG: thioredoxin family protein [Ktedonobacteraceae bacterium]|nr:thioredoxin family protein [Ktedonobacteraceae bacterium]
MTALIIRLAVLALVALGSWLLVRIGKHFVEVKRQRALAAPATPFASFKIQILSFSSDDCRQCKLQAPILQRILEARGDAISVTEIDAPAQPELSSRYQVLTVPTTVVLDTNGKAQAINYGFANTQKLLTQIDALLS